MLFVFGECINDLVILQGDNDNGDNNTIKILSNISFGEGPLAGQPGTPSKLLDGDLFEVRNPSWWSALAFHGLGKSASVFRAVI